jgi:hypothetical protein
MFCPRCKAAYSWPSSATMMRANPADSSIHLGRKSKCKKKTAVLILVPPFPPLQHSLLVVYSSSSASGTLTAASCKSWTRDICTLRLNTAAPCTTTVQRPLQSAAAAAAATAWPPSHPAAGTVTEHFCECATINSSTLTRNRPPNALNPTTLLGCTPNPSFSLPPEQRLPH